MRYLFALGVFSVLVAGGSSVYAAQPDCEPFRCAVQSAVAAQCPCNLGVPAGTVAANHGQYVSCVAKAVRDLTNAGTIKNSKARSPTARRARSVARRASSPAKCQCRESATPRRVRAERIRQWRASRMRIAPARGARSTAQQRCAKRAAASSVRVTPAVPTVAARTWRRRGG